MKSRAVGASVEVKLEEYIGVGRGAVGPDLEAKDILRSMRAHDNRLAMAQSDPSRLPISSDPRARHNRSSGAPSVDQEGLSVHTFNREVLTRNVPQRRVAGFDEVGVVGVVLRIYRAAGPSELEGEVRDLHAIPVTERTSGFWRDCH